MSVQSLKTQIDNTQSFYIGGVNQSASKRLFKAILDLIGVPSGPVLYSATLQQLGGANAPAGINVVVNTIGAIVFTRLSVGFYRATLSGAFPLAKTVISTRLQSYKSNGVDKEVYMFVNSDNDINILVRNISDGALAELNSEMFGIEIRVYP